MSLHLTINGESREFDATMSVDRLLAELGIDLRHVAVERNRTLVPKREFEATILENGDVLEIVTFVGGG